MHHRIVLKNGTHDHKPYNIQCSCGTGGDFGGKEEAVGWMQQNHISYLRGVNTAEIVDETMPTAPVEAAPVEALGEMKAADEEKVS